MTRFRLYACQGITSWYGLPLAWRSLAAVIMAASWLPHADAEPPTASPGTNKEEKTQDFGKVLHNLDLRVDCLHNFNRSRGESQACAEVTGLRYRFQENIGASLETKVSLDPFGTLYPAREAWPIRADLPLTRYSDLGIIDDFSLTWLPRPGLELKIGSFASVVNPKGSLGLALQNPYFESGFKQLAVTVTYNLAVLPDTKVMFAVGNGEGELSTNQDPQQYVGIEAVASPITGVQLGFGLSQDGNSQGSDAYRWGMQRLSERCGVDANSRSQTSGYQAQRLAAFARVDGRLNALPGLHAQLAVQRSTLTDLDRQHTAFITNAELERCSQIDVDYFFVENEPGKNASSVIKNVYQARLGYFALGSYLLAVEYATRALDAGNSKPFVLCNDYNGDTCKSANSARESTLSQEILSVAAGLVLAQDLFLSLEYGLLSYDRKYTNAFYLDDKGKAATGFELFNARLAYRWQ